MHIAKIEQLTKQKLFPSRKLNLIKRQERVGSANENASQKYDNNLIVLPFIYAKQKWLLTTEDPKEEVLKYIRPFWGSHTFETIPSLFLNLFTIFYAARPKSPQRDIMTLYCYTQIYIVACFLP